MFGEIKEKIVSLLRRSEFYMQTDMVYLVKNGGWLMFDRVVFMGVSFGLSIAFANLLAKETYGTYRYVISVVNILTLFTLSGMGTAVARAVAQGKDGVVKPAIDNEIKWGLLGGLTSLAIAGYYYFSGNEVLSTTFLVIAIFTPFLNVFSLYSSISQGKKRFDLYVRYDILTQLIHALLILPLLWYTKQVWILFLPYLFTNSLLQFVWLKLTTLKIKLNDIQDFAAIKYGKELSLLNVLGSVALLADQIIIFNFLGPVQTAIYSLALAPTEQIKAVFKMIGPLASPKFAVQSKDTLRENINKKVYKFLLVISITIILYVILAPYLFQLLFPSYTSSVIYSQILAVSLIGSVGILPLVGLQAQGESKLLASYNIVVPVVQIVALMISVGLYGLMGAVWVRLVTRIFDFIYLMILLNKKRS